MKVSSKRTDLGSAEEDEKGKKRRRTSCTRAPFSRISAASPVYACLKIDPVTRTESSRRAEGSGCRTKCRSARDHRSGRGVTRANNYDGLRGLDSITPATATPPSPLPISRPRRLNKKLRAPHGVVLRAMFLLKCFPNSEIYSFGPNRSVCAQTVGIFFSPGNGEAC